MTQPHPGWGTPRVVSPVRPTPPSQFGRLLLALLDDADQSQVWLARRTGYNLADLNRTIRHDRGLSLGLLAAIVRVFPDDRDRLIAAALDDADRRRAG